LGTKSKSSVPDPSNILLPLDPDQMNQIKLIKIIQKILNKQNKKKLARLFLWKSNWKISKGNQIKHTKNIESQKNQIIA
jgi:hypothetical protein